MFCYAMLCCATTNLGRPKRRRSVSPRDRRGDRWYDGGSGGFRSDNYYNDYGNPYWGAHDGYDSRAYNSQSRYTKCTLTGSLFDLHPLLMHPPPPLLLLRCNSYHPSDIHLDYRIQSNMNIWSPTNTLLIMNEREAEDGSMTTS